MEPFLNYDFQTSALGSPTSGHTQSNEASSVPVTNVLHMSDPGVRRITYTGAPRTSYCTLNLPYAYNATTDQNGNLLRKVRENDVLTNVVTEHLI